jgi:hypothetical protein
MTITLGKSSYMPILSVTVNSDEIIAFVCMQAMHVKQLRFSKTMLMWLSKYQVDGRGCWGYMRTFKG